MNRRAAFGTVLTAGALAVAPGAWACGFENPAMMRKGLLNLIYPKSLYVGTAVWQAQAAGLLDKDPPLGAARRLFINPGYRKAVKALETFANRLPPVPGDKQSSFVVLLMEAMLWTRVHPGGRAPIVPHVQGAEPGEALLITQRVVLDALNSGRVSARQAGEAGLFRLYGKDGAVAQLATILGTTVVGAEFL